MKSIKEKQILVKWARAMNVSIDQDLIKEVDRYNALQENVVASVRGNIFSNQIQEEYLQSEEVLSNPYDTESLIDRASKFISKELKSEENSYQQSEAPPTAQNFKEVTRKLKFLEEWIAKVSLAGPGGGAVNLRDLDDVSKYSVSNASEKQVLSFNAQSKLWVASNQTVDSLINGNAVVMLNADGTTTIPGNIIPLQSNVYTLGTPTLKWKDLYVGPGSINLEDTVTQRNANLTVSSGVLQVNGADQLQVGQLKFANNTIQSTTSNIDIQFGYLTDTANIVINRNTVLPGNVSLTVNGNFTPKRGIIHPVKEPTLAANSIIIDFFNDELIHLHTPAPGTIVTATLVNLSNTFGKTVEVLLVSSAGGSTQFNHGVSSTNSTNGNSFFLTTRNTMYIKYFNLDGTTGNTFVTAIGNNSI